MSLAIIIQYIAIKVRVLINLMAVLIAADKYLAHMHTFSCEICMAV